MRAAKKVKDLAKKLYMEGESTEKIAIKCNVSKRTIQRWILKFKEEIVSTTIESDTLTILEKISKKSGEKLDLTTTSKMAVHLISITEKALTVVEDVLANPNVRIADKLKAVQIIGEWSGLKDKNVIRKITNAFDVDLSENIDINTALADLLPKKLIEAGKISEKKLEEERKDYTYTLYNYFCTHEKLFDEIDEKIFDVELFMSYLTCDEDDENYSLYLKAKSVLVESGLLLVDS